MSLGFEASFILCMLWAVYSLSGQTPALASKKCEMGKKPWDLAVVLSFIAHFGSIALCSFRV